MSTQKVLVWDLPTRVFHWVFAISFVVAFITHESERQRLIHIVSGYVFFAALLFRLLWGIRGSRYARFGSFVKGPSSLLSHLRQEVFARRSPTPHFLGHNPAGGVAIILMLVLGMGISVSGLLMDLPYITTWGADWVSAAASEFAEELHETSANTMALIVLFHWLGVAWGRWHYGKGFIAAMVHGRKQGLPDAGISHPHTLLGMALLLFFVWFVWWLI